MQIKLVPGSVRRATQAAGRVLAAQDARRDKFRNQLLELWQSYRSPDPPAHRSLSVLDAAFAMARTFFSESEYMKGKNQRDRDEIMLNAGARLQQIMSAKTEQEFKTFINFWYWS